MSVVDWIQRLWKKEAQHFVFAPIPASPQRQDVPIAQIDLRAEQHYLRVWVSEMFLAEDRRLFREYDPVVHSAIRLQFADKPAQELPYVAGPHNLGLGTTVGRGVQVNHPLTNLLPFRGGTVTVSTALLAYKRKDFFQGFVEILHDVSGLLNIGQLSATLKVVGGAVDGIQNLLGAGEKDVHLVYFEGFGGTTGTGGATLSSGYTAVIRANATQLNKDNLFIKTRQLHYGQDLASATPLLGFDYMLLRYEAALERDDYGSFDEFKKLLNDAIREGLRDRAKGDTIMQTVQTVVWASPDLTKADRVRVAFALRRDYESALDGLLGPDDAGPGVRELDSIVHEVPIEQGLRVVDTIADDEGALPLDRFLEAVSQHGTAVRSK